MSLNIIREKMFSKKVICYIDGDEGKKFIEQYKDVLNIVGYFSFNYRMSHGYVDKYTMKEMFQLEDVYIILCCDNPKKNAEIWEFLCDDFVYMDDVIDQELAEAVIEGRNELLLVVGVCQQKWISFALNGIPDFRKQCYSRYIFFTFLGKRQYQFMFEKMLEYCTWFVKIKTLIIHDSVSEWMETVCQQYSEKVYNMPFMDFSVIFPQVSWKSTGTNSNVHDYYYESMKYPNVRMRSLLYKDDNIVHLIEKGYSAEEILNTISNTDFYSKEEMERRLLVTHKKMEMVERQCQIRMSEWIFGNFREKQLYIDGVHFSDVMIYQYCYEIMKVCGIKYGSFAETSIILEQGKHKTEYLNELPVYPSVARHLGLKWADENRLYNCSRATGYKQLTFWEAEKEYIEYLQIGKKMNEYI